VVVGFESVFVALATLSHPTDNVHVAWATGGVLELALTGWASGLQLSLWSLPSVVSTPNVTVPVGSEPDPPVTVAVKTDPDPLAGGVPPSDSVTFVGARPTVSEMLALAAGKFGRSPP
jgi:hypothetical protein